MIKLFLFVINEPEFFWLFLLHACDRCLAVVIIRKVIYVVAWSLSAGCIHLSFATSKDDRSAGSVSPLTSSLMVIVVFECSTI